MMVTGGHDVIGIVRGDLVGLDMVEEVILDQGALGAMGGR